MPADAIPPTKPVERAGTQPLAEIVGGIVISFVVGIIVAFLCFVLTGFGSEAVAISGVCGLALAILGPGIVMALVNRRASDGFDRVSAVNWTAFTVVPLLLCLYLAINII